MSSRDRLVRATSRRSVRRTTSAIVALLLTAGGGFAAYLGITRLVTSNWPTWAVPTIDRLPPVRWVSPWVIGLEVTLALLGAALIALAFRPGVLRVARLSAPESPAIRHSDVTISRSGIARLAAAQADEIDAVDGLSTTATGRRVELHVDTRSADRTQVSSSVKDAVAQRLGDAGLQPVPRVTVKVRSRAAA